MTILFDLIFLFAVGITLNYFLIWGLSLGIGGSYLKHKIANNDYSWLNILIFWFICFYLPAGIVILLFSQTIYLDTKVDVVVGVENTQISLSGPLFQQLIAQFGSITAFATGVKVGGIIYAKTNMHPLNKVGNSLVVGAASVITWKLLEMNDNIYQSKYRIKNISENKIDISIDEITVAGDVSVDFKDESMRNKFFELFGNLKKQMNVTEKSFKSDKVNFDKIESLQLISNKKAKIVDLVDTSVFYNNSTNESQLTEDLISKDTNIIINSPLEDTFTITKEGHDYLILLLNYSLILNLIIAYLVFIIIFIFTIKYIVDAESLKNKIDSNKVLPNILKRILTKLINGWTFSSKFWIYFNLISSLVFVLVSAKISHACLFILTPLSPFPPFG